MAGKGTLSLRLPSRQYDARGRADFETPEAAAREDRWRARRLRLTALSEHALAGRLLRLADRVDPSVTDRPHTSASSRWMRRYRIRLVGALWRLYDEA